MDVKQKYIDAFYKNHGKCCAGCDWWRWYNTVIGECTKTAPVSSSERLSMTGIIPSIQIQSGHILTERSHVCGDFIDSV